MIGRWVTEAIVALVLLALALVGLGVAVGLIGLFIGNGSY